MFTNTVNTLKSDVSDLDKYTLEDTDEESFFEQIKDLHIGEWRKNYTLDRFGCCAPDGSEWTLSIYFSNGQIVKKGGVNAYPYNFNRLLQILNLHNND